MSKSLDYTTAICFCFFCST